MIEDIVRKYGGSPELLREIVRARARSDYRYHMDEIRAEFVKYGGYATEESVEAFRRKLQDELTAILPLMKTQTQKDAILSILALF